MVAQGSDKRSGRFCDRCFATVADTERFCPECGAPMTKDARAEGTDTIVYPELSRVNLLRMRGDYAGSEAQALAILKRFPNNATAHVLLGDICMDKSDFQQALQWYELALDLTPDNAAAKKKVAQAQQRLKDQETIATAEQLGLPTTRSRAGIYAATLLGSVLVIAVVAYILGGRVQQNRASGKTLNVPIEAPATGEESPTGKPSAMGSSTMVVGAAPEEDRQLMQAIVSKSAEGGRIVSTMQDPRSKALVVTYAVPIGENERLIGARIARDSFEAVNDALMVTVRGMRKGSIIFMADAPRSKYEEILTPGWQSVNGEDESAWVNHLLVNQWPAVNSAPVDQNAPPGSDTVPQEQPQDPGTIDDQSGSDTGDNI